MTWSLRICRHCRKPVPLSAHACPHCQGKLMDPHKFMLSVWVMGLILFVAFTGVVLAYLTYHQAYERAYCQEDVYARDFVTEGESCAELCTTTCQKHGYTQGQGPLISQVYSADRTDVQISCACACQGCA